MNSAHAGCCTEPFLKQIGQILAAKGRDLAIVHVEQLHGQGSHLGQSAPVSRKGKEMAATQLGALSPWKAP